MIAVLAGLRERPFIEELIYGNIFEMLRLKFESESNAES